MQSPGIAGAPHNTLSPFEYRHHEVLKGINLLILISIFLPIYDMPDFIWGIWVKIYRSLKSLMAARTATIEWIEPPRVCWMLIAMSPTPPERHP